MNFCDSLLLESPPVDVWIAYRADGVRGSGTQSDPFNGSTQNAFDSAMASIPSGKPIRVHLGPSTADKPFKTAGFRLGSNGGALTGGWQPKPGMVIVGSGIDVTHLQVVTDSAPEGSYCFAIGAPTTACLDNFEVSGMTIDCNLPENSAIACGAIRVWGNHVRIREVKIIRWGSGAMGVTCCGIHLLGGDPDPGSPWLTVHDVGIDDCVAVQPSANTAAGAPVFAFYIGGRETATSGVFYFSRGPYIRNCFVDGRLDQLGTPDFNLDLRAYAMAVCHGGAIEGNLASNISVGCTAQERVNFRDLTVRNNIFSNVGTGVMIKNVVASANLLPNGYSADAFCYDDNGYYFAIATVPRRVMAYCASGDVVLLQGTESAYNGFFALWLSDSGELAYDVPALSPDGSISSVQRILGFQHLLVEGNTIELADLEGAVAITIGTADSVLQFPTHGPTVIRNNRIRSVVDSLTPGQIEAVRVWGVKSLNLTENVVDTVVHAGVFGWEWCGPVTLIGNCTFAGEALNQSVDRYERVLRTPADDALFSSCLT